MEKLMAVVAMIQPHLAIAPRHWGSNARGTVIAQHVDTDLHPCRGQGVNETRMTSIYKSARRSSAASTRPSRQVGSDRQATRRTRKHGQVYCVFVISNVAPSKTPVKPSFVMYEPFASARLLYRAVEATDTKLFEAIQTDASGYQNSNARAAVPQSRKDAAEYLRMVAEDTLLGVVICLPSANPIASADPIDATPIGVIHLSAASPSLQHCRHSDLSIDILPAFQGKGYGSEAIAWVLRWAFLTRGLHRVQVRAFEYNEGARRLYEKLGFKPEGRWREFLWFRGRWWDDFQFAILDREWLDMQKENKEHKEITLSRHAELFPPASDVVTWAVLMLIAALQTRALPLLERAPVPKDFKGNNLPQRCTECLISRWHEDESIIRAIEEPLPDQGSLECEQLVRPRGPVWHDHTRIRSSGKAFLRDATSERCSSFAHRDPDARIKERLFVLHDIWPPMAILHRLRTRDSLNEAIGIGCAETEKSRHNSVVATSTWTASSATQEGMSSMFRRLRRTNKNTNATVTIADEVVATPTVAREAEKLTFFALPPELRNVIYEHVASTTLLRLPTTLSSTSLSSRRKDIVEPTGLLLTSRKCRQEFLPLLLSMAQVIVDVRDFYFKPLMRVTSSLYSTELKALRENNCLIIRLHMHNCARENLATLRKWLVNRSSSLDKLPWAYEVELAPTTHLVGRIRQRRELSLYVEELRRMESKMEESLQWELAAIIATFTRKCREIEQEFSEAGAELPTFSAANIRGLSGGGIR
nr:putative n-acetyltransferase ynad [Quercus suber]